MFSMPSELELSKITSSPVKISETKYPPLLMLESFNTKLLDGGFRDSEPGLVSITEVNIFCPPKGCLVVDIPRESKCQKLPATLFISLILI
jgi:hypothetical protein